MLLQFTNLLQACLNKSAYWLNEGGGWRPAAVAAGIAEATARNTVTPLMPLFCFVFFPKTTKLISNTQQGERLFK